MTSSSRLRAAVCAAAAVAAWQVGAASASAQERPNFSGTWSAGDGSSGGTGLTLGPKFTIVHEGNTLTLTRTVGTGAVAMTHPLDGTETRTRMPARLCEGDSISIYSAAWDGPAVKLSLTGVVPPGGGQPTRREAAWTLRMESPDTLVVQLVNVTSAQAPPRTTTTSYKKTTDAPVVVARPSVQRAEAAIAQLSWLPGVWVGTAGSNVAEERWTPAAGGSMLAVSRTLRNDLMIAFEFLCIVERDGGLVYTAMPNGRQPATEFVLSALTADSATFENPAHDFPKKIQYVRKADGSMDAIISGDPNRKPQVFSFRKQ